jgi:hypothetical protein
MGEQVAEQWGIQAFRVLIKAWSPILEVGDQGPVLVSGLRAVCGLVWAQPAHGHSRILHGEMGTL